ncbi:MAG: hypothetical protein R3B72_11225 [Polyangiaceae bacterium]
MTRRLTLLALPFALPIALLPWIAGDAVADPTPSATAGTPSAAWPNLAELDLPTAASPAPTRDEWKSARGVALASSLPPSCHAHLLREWLRVRCNDTPPQAGAVLSGPSEDVAFYASIPRVPELPDMLDITKGYVEVVMPLRRGESRVVELTRRSTDDYGPSWQLPFLLLSQQWSHGEGGPVVLTDHHAWDDDDVLGMRLGTIEEAKKLGVRTDATEPVVLSVRPGSAADRGGAKPGDFVSPLAEDWRRDLAFSAFGANYDLLLVRRGVAKSISLPQRSRVRSRLPAEAPAEEPATR